MARRLKAMGQEKYAEGFEPTFHLEELGRPARWKKPRRIFVCSMGDLFGPWFSDEIVRRVIAVAHINPRHTLQFLTKNPARLPEFNPWPQNAWVGATVTDQAMLDDALPHLAEVQAPVRFLSVEPIHGPIILQHDDPLQWVIVGRQTGPGAKRAPFEVEWVTDLVHQARSYEVPIFAKDNLGELATVQQFPGVDDV
jgi:protein gp37